MSLCLITVAYLTTSYRLIEVSATEVQSHLFHVGWKSSHIHNVGHCLGPGQTLEMGPAHFPHHF